MDLSTEEKALEDAMTIVFTLENDTDAATNPDGKALLRRIRLHLWDRTCIVRDAKREGKICSAPNF